jgi:DNA-binding FadR family transcriptional regulator
MTSTRANEVADRLEKLASQQSAGTHLGTKDQLREQLGVSPSTLNEGIRLATERGSISIRRGPAGGIFAARPSAASALGRSLMTLDLSDPSIPELLRMRNALEVLVGIEALETCTLHDLKPLESSLQRLQELADTEDSAAFLTECHVFQRHVASLVSNDLLRAVYTTVIDELDRQAKPNITRTDEVQSVALHNRRKFFERAYWALRERNKQELYHIAYESSIGWNPWKEFLVALDE